MVVSDPDSGTLNVSFFGRPLASGVFAPIGTATGIASGAHATTSWTGLGGGQTYEWFATVSDGTTTTTGPTWTFHTAAESRSGVRRYRRHRLLRPSPATTATAEP